MLVTIIIPCFNEDQVIEQTYNRICSSLDKFNLEIIFVDDGSSDNTLQILTNLSINDKRVKIIEFSRNFGHQPAVSSGLFYSNGDCVVIIDADLQDPPEIIPKMIDLWKEGYEVIYGQRKNRKENIVKRMSYYIFYRFYKMIANIDVALDSGDFCLMDRKVVRTINQLPEKNRFLRGLRSWAGFKQTSFPYERDTRQAGEPKYDFRMLLNLAWDGIFNFSIIPLKMISFVGIITSIFSILGIIFFLIQRTFNLKLFSLTPTDMPGWTSLVLIVLFIGGLQLLCLGIMGEYLGRLYYEAKSRPTFVVKKFHNFKSQGNKN